jgi:hypothetical protein
MEVCSTADEQVRISTPLSRAAPIDDALSISLSSSQMHLLLLRQQ